jgi:hypothetical protein
MEIINLIFGLIALAFIAVGGLFFTKIGLVLVGTALIAGLGWKLRHQPLKAAAIVLPIMAVLLWIGSIQVPKASDFRGNYKQVSIKQQEITRAACEADAKVLQAKYRVDSVVDEVGALSPEALVGLLAERKLAFVELRVSTHTAYGPVPAIGPHILDASQLIHYWRVDQPVGSYAKVALAAPTSPACVSDAALPEPVQKHLAYVTRAQPMCITLSFAGNASASHAIVYQADAIPTAHKLGSYRLVNKPAQQVLAQLSTHEDPDRPALGDQLSPPQDPQTFARIDCRKPHTTLANRLVGISLEP